MSLSHRQADELREKIELMCREAGEIQLRHWRKIDQVEKKGDIDLVTIADKQSEAHIIERIREFFPQHLILAEEGGFLGPASDYVWIIDPLDGTTNFAHGLPIFAVSIGLHHKGRPIAGGVFAPALNELYLAARKFGTTRNGEPVAVSKTTELINTMITTGFPYQREFVLDWIMHNLREFVSKCRGVVRMGAASYDLACIAAGNMDAFYETDLKPWDMAAGQLLVEEAGGKITNFKGEEFDLHNRQLVASNGTELHELVVEILKANPHNFDVSKR